MQKLDEFMKSYLIYKIFIKNFVFFLNLIIIFFLQLIKKFIKRFLIKLITVLLGLIINEIMN